MSNLPKAGGNRRVDQVLTADFTKRRLRAELGDSAS
jgi:hypothetical protein